MFDKIVLASGNAGKLKEFSRLFADLNIEVLPQSQFDTPECPEPYRTFVENALAKARHAAKHSGLPALADDSGICAAALKRRTRYPLRPLCRSKPQIRCRQQQTPFRRPRRQSRQKLLLRLRPRPRPPRKRPAAHHRRRHLARPMADRSRRNPRFRLRPAFLPARTQLHRRRACPRNQKRRKPQGTGVAGIVEKN